MYLKPNSELNCNIAICNDNLRNYLPDSPPKPHKLILSAKIGILRPAKQRAILHQVKKFKLFNLENDPNNEHDYGDFIFEQTTIVWKIERIVHKQAICLTVMFDDEY